MRHTMMGKDMHIVETLVPLGTGDEVLLTEDVRTAAEKEGVPPNLVEPVTPDLLRGRSAWDNWQKRYSNRKLFRLSLQQLNKAEGGSQ